MSSFHILRPCLGGRVLARVELFCAHRPAVPSCPAQRIGFGVGAGGRSDPGRPCWETNGLTSLALWSPSLASLWLGEPRLAVCGNLLIILWMSYFLHPHLIGLLAAAKTVSS